MDASAGIHYEPQPSEKAVQFDGECYGSNVAVVIDKPGATVDFSKPPDDPYEKWMESEVIPNEVGRLEVGLFGGADKSNLIMDPIVSYSEPQIGPGSFQRGGQAIIEFTDSKGNTAKVAIVTIGTELGIYESEDSNLIELVNKRAELDDPITTYIIGPNGEVVKEKDGFSMPPPVTIGAEYSRVNSLVENAHKPGVRDPKNVLAFANLGKVSRVIIDARRTNATANLLLGK